MSCCKAVRRSTAPASCSRCSRYPVIPRRISPTTRTEASSRATSSLRARSDAPTSPEETGAFWSPRSACSSTRCPPTPSCTPVTVRRRRSGTSSLVTRSSESCVRSEPGELSGEDRATARDTPVSYTHLRAHETKANLVCRLLLEKKKKQQEKNIYYLSNVKKTQTL